MAAGSVGDTCIAVVNNIPPFYHSVDLRNFFSQFIESGRFDCFHFRHRPEKQVPSIEGNDELAQDKTVNKNESRNTTCCVIRLKRQNLSDLLKLYHNTNWLDKNGDSISSVCLVTEIELPNHTIPTGTEGVSNGSYKTKTEKKQIAADRVDFTEADLLRLPELNPPSMMPQGNIGTPTQTFLSYIQECRLPPKIIQKLGLKFPRTRPRKHFGTVAYDYGSRVNTCDESNSESEVSEPEITDIKKLDAYVAECSKEKHLQVPVHQSKENTSKDAQSKVAFVQKESWKIPSKSETMSPGVSLPMENEYIRKRLEKKAEKRRIRKLKAERIEEKLIGDKSESEEDNDDCEEWERHEANYDDPTNQARNSERLFEEKIELKWEKGGSGLVFYTDAQYWKKLEGDFDEQCADDWDVDMSVYYEEGAGDKDSMDLLTMRREKRRRAGIEHTDRYTEGKIGKFEKHTKGVGRKIMEYHGWKDGQGLGAAVDSSIVEALENDGQHPRDKKGLGYFGEKLNKLVPTRKKKHKNNHLITTIYDDPETVDPAEALLRRNEPYIIKHTPGVSHINFTKGSAKSPDK